MAKKKKSTTVPLQQKVIVFVPDAVYNLGTPVDELIGRINYFWAQAFGVQEVDVNPISDLTPCLPIAARHRHKG